MADFDWNHMRAFLATVERGSLSAAARRLGLTQPTLSRQIAALEDELGILLFERVGKRLELTEAGQRLAGHVREMGTAADRVGLAASGQSSEVEGVVRITTIDVFAAYVLPSIMQRLATGAPGIVLEVIASNAIDDLMRREADIAIRHVPPSQPELIARRCPDSQIGLYAATRFLDAVGRPATPGDCARLPFIGFPESEILIKELNARGIPLRDDALRWRCASSLINWQLIREGFGYGIMFREAVKDTDGVEAILPEVAPITAPMWLVAHRELYTSRRIRLVFDALYDELSRRNLPSG
jgi:DNA-binding transcriptional LysR family regulator